MTIQHQLDIDDNARSIMAETYSDPVRVKRGLYEMEYYNLYGELPPDAIVIERIEWYGDNSLIIHQDPDALRQ